MREEGVPGPKEHGEHPTWDLHAPRVFKGHAKNFGPDEQEVSERRV